MQKYLHVLPAPGGIMKNVTIIGATGFGGLGLIEIILRHPQFRITRLIARKDIGIPVSDIFPYLKGHCELTIEPFENISFNETDITFFQPRIDPGMTMINEFYSRDIR